MQRQYNVGLNANPGTISYSVDKRRYHRMGPRGPEKAWIGDNNDILRNRRYLDPSKPKHSPKVHGPMLGRMKHQPVNMMAAAPKYSPGYTSDVSHLVV